MNSKSGSGPYFVGVDVGGTNIETGIVDDSGTTLSRASSKTQAARGPELGLQTIFKSVESAIAQSPVSMEDVFAIGLATPGTMDLRRGMLLDPPNLPGWVNLPIRQIVADHFQKPVVLQNDANAAAYGEYWVGAARDAHSMAFWTLGTGIGCGIIIGDTIIQGEHSHGSECGHIIIDMNGERKCGTGQYGTLEAYAGAKALVSRCREALNAGRQSSLSAMLDQGDDLTPLLIAQAAQSGDALADELVMDTARYMGIATTTLMHTIDPNMFLLGGAMTFGGNDSELGRRFLKRIKDEVQTRAFPVPAEQTKIDFASLGNEAGYIGAAGCARREFHVEFRSR